MTTDNAQRRLLEALAALDRTPGGIDGLQLGLQAAIPVAEGAGVPAIAEIYRALSQLGEAVKNDKKEAVR